MASIAGAEVELWEGGQGRPLLLLHPGDGFDPAADFVRELTASHRVIGSLNFTPSEPERKIPAMREVFFTAISAAIQPPKESPTSTRSCSPSSSIRSR